MSGTKKVCVLEIRNLKNFATTPPRISYRTTKEEVRYEKSWWFRTLRHPVLTEIYNQFYTTDSYRCGRKVVPDSLIDSIDSFVMAVWVMDDGSYNQGKIDISTYSFTLQEIEKLCSIIKRNSISPCFIIKIETRGIEYIAIKQKPKNL